MKKTFIVFLFFLIFFLPVCAVLGDDDDGGMGGVDITEPSQITSMLEGIRNWIYGLFVVAVVICFLIAAFLFITAAGNPERLQKAKDMVRYGLYGAIIALLAGGISELVKSFLELGNGGGGGGEI